jgi:DNA-binding transcriptional LysR family regulator
MDKLNLINTFLKVADRGSFSAAAAYIGADPSTISKAISQLESHLGCRLFIRTTRQLQLSTAGKHYRDHCRLLLENLSACEQALATGQTEAKGLLRINLPMAYGQLYVMPMMGRFHEKYPEIELDISLSDEHVDMVSHSIDVAIRSGELKDSRLVAKKLSPMDFATVASQEFIKRHPPIRSSNIEALPWVNYRFIHSGRTMPLFNLTGDRRPKKMDLIDPDNVALIVTDGLSMIRAGIEGVGLLQAPHFLLRDAVTKGELEIIQSYYRSVDFNIYAYYSSKDHLPLKVRVFLDFISVELARMGENTDTTFLSNLE